MGNYVSCTMLGPARQRQWRVSKVIYPGGEVRQFYEAVKAAELMMEAPSFFAVEARSLQIGRRFSALAADEELEMGSVYVMFPMKRLTSVVTAADMGAMFIAANSAAKRASSGKVGVLPESSGGSGGGGDDCGRKTAEEPRLKLEDMEEFSTPEFKHRLSMCRSKKPLLETIVEEPIWLR